MTKSQGAYGDQHRSSLSLAKVTSNNDARRGASSPPPPLSLLEACPLQKRRQVIEVSRMMKLKLQKSLRSTEDASSVGNGNHSDESDIPCSRIDDEEYPSDAFSALANHQQAALGFPRAETAAPALPSSRCGLGSQRSLRHPIASLHAQALILGVAFCALWTPSNIMAPNLTKMAEDFGLREQERDIYLGSYCALAVGVFSFPISAIIGLSVDLGHCSRKSLLVLTCIMSASAALLTALSQAYWQLFLCRFAQGGFMGASVPIVFSFLSDMFAPSERNVASSGLTAMMGVGILLGQLYAGFNGWRQAFFLSSGLQLMVALLCLWSIRDPPRGAKELALQELFRSGSHYDRKLTFRSFHASVVKNKSNSILLWQGFFSSIPWGVIFCFLNDYLSQERGFPVPDATLLVFLFGVGCTLGGVLGGWAGGWLGTLPQGSGLPLFMALSTSAAILPFFFLLNSSIVDPRGFKCIGLALSCGMVASLPAVNVRPCLISVNPPETRGSSLTAANLLIQLGRGIGPSFVTGVICRFQTSRQFAFNLSLISFWLVSSLQLLFLAKTLPHDRQTVEDELAVYARNALARAEAEEGSSVSEHEIILIEDRVFAFNGQAARQSISFVSEGVRELGYDILLVRCKACTDDTHSLSRASSSSQDSSPADYGSIACHESASLLPLQE